MYKKIRLCYAITRLFMRLYFYIPICTMAFYLHQHGCMEAAINI